MTISEFLIDHLPEKAYDQPNFCFWVRTVLDAMALLGPDSDDGLDRLSGLLVDYHSGADVAREDVEGVSREIVRLGVDTSWRNETPLGLKYRCLWAIGGSREQHLADLYNWQYGVVTAFNNINIRHDKDQVLIGLILGNASRYGADLHETGGDG